MAQLSPTRSLVRSLVSFVPGGLVSVFLLLSALARGTPTLPSGCVDVLSCMPQCDAGGLDACVRLGELYRDSTSVEETRYSRAAALFKRACEGGVARGSAEPRHDRVRPVPAVPEAEAA